MHVLQLFAKNVLPFFVEQLPTRIPPIPTRIPQIPARNFDVLLIFFKFVTNYFEVTFDLGAPGTTPPISPDVEIRCKPFQTQSCFYEMRSSCNPPLALPQPDFRILKVCQNSFAVSIDSDWIIVNGPGKLKLTFRVWTCRSGMLGLGLES